MGSPSCSLAILVARTDIPFMMHTIPHLVKMCNFPFTERLLVVDAGKLSGDYLRRPGIGSLEDLRACCQQLLDDGVMTRTIDIDFSDAYRERVYRKHFQGRIRETHNYRGAPVLGYITCIEQTQGDYVLFFDCDMLLYQQPGHSWIADAIQLMEQHPDLMNVLPLAGPPAVTGRGHAYENARCDRHPEGFYKLKRFTSRRFLLHRQRFEDFLPLTVKWLPPRNKPRWMPTGVALALSQITGRGGLERWENLMSDRFATSPYYRADLDTAAAWTLHPHQHGPDFVAALPQIIEKVETGWYPPEQAGFYDLTLAAWLEALQTTV